MIYPMKSHDTMTSNAITTHTLVNSFTWTEPAMLGDLPGDSVNLWRTVRTMAVIVLLATKRTDIPGGQAVLWSPHTVTIQEVEAGVATPLHHLRGVGAPLLPGGRT